MEDEAAALRRRIADLEEIKHLREREAELLATMPTGPSSTKRRSSSSSSSGEIKLKNMVTFSLNFTIKQRDDWLLDLQQTFAGASKKYQKDKKKILKALAEMEPECRSRWNRHLSELVPRDREKANESWDIFEEWTMTLLKHAYNQEAQIMKKLNQAMQLPTQAPEDFHAYLDSLEKKFTAETEDKRALLFLSKLQPDLQSRIETSVPTLPKTRKEMVELASRHWSILHPHKRKRPQDDDGKGGESSKNHRRDQADSSTNRDRSDRTRGRGGYRGRGRGRPTGHSSPDTRQPKEDLKTNNRIFACYTCGSKFHGSRDCPDRDKVAQVSEAKAEARPKNRRQSN
jgi:hypothetical protein